MRHAWGWKAVVMLAVAAALVLGVSVGGAQAMPTQMLFVDPILIDFIWDGPACEINPFRWDFYPVFCEPQAAMFFAIQGGVVWVANPNQFDCGDCYYQGFKLQTDNVVVVGEFAPLGDFGVGCGNIYIASNFSVARGFEVQGDPCVWSWLPGIYVRGSYNTVANNFVHHTLNDGIVVDARSFHNNIIANRVTAVGTDSCGQGIRVNWGSPPAGSGTVISYNVVLDPCDDGIFIGRPALVSFNVVLDADPDGIEVAKYGTGTSLTKNIVLDSDHCDLERFGTPLPSVPLSGNITEFTWVNFPGDCQHP